MSRLPFRKLRHRMYLPVLESLYSITEAVSRETLWSISGIIARIFCSLKLSSNETLELHRRTVMRSLGLECSSFEIYRSLVAGYLDFLHLSHLDDVEFQEVITVEGAEHLADALDAGNGCILITAHYSAWELSPRAVVNLGHRIGIIHKELDDSEVSAFLNDLRRKPGVDSVDRSRGPGALLRLLRQNAAVGILIDQDTMGADGEFVDFLGIPARTPTGPAKIALRFGIPVSTLHIRRNKDRDYILVIDKPVDTSTFSGDDGHIQLTEVLNRRIGEWIHEDPAQWVWIHKRWHHRPDGSTGLR